MNATALLPNAVRPPASVTLTDGIKGLTAIRETGCAAVILKRHPMSTLETWLNSLETEQLPSARVILEPCRIQEALCQICDNCGTPTGPERRALMQDIATLAKRFADLMDVRYLRLRLDVVTTNACRKFHIDAVTARLICTYRGQTTQLGEAEPGCDPDRYISVPAGAPVVLRGTKWSGDAPTRLRHRSPPIAGTGESRLLLVLDPIYDLEEKV
jgi:hypothetical protein